MLVTDVLFPLPVAVVVAAGTAALFASLWYVMPLRRRCCDKRAFPG